MPRRGISLADKSSTIISYFQVTCPLKKDTLFMGILNAKNTLYPIQLTSARLRVCYLRSIWKNDQFYI